MRRLWNTTEGSTGRLIQLCLGYFVFYVVTGVTVKYFQNGPPAMKEIEFTTYSTIGGTALCMAVVLVMRWYRLAATATVSWGPLRFPREYLYIVPSGVCTAVVIPTTTLMYSLPISVMVAMVIMRGGVIIISRIVDAVQIAQGILKKKVYAEENVAVVFALAAVGVQVFWNVFAPPPAASHGAATPATVAAAAFPVARAAIIFGSYIVAYLIRIYIMNYYKNTRPKGARFDNTGFFAIEQIAATVTLVAVGALLFLGTTASRDLLLYRSAIATPRAPWGGAIVAGTAFGAVAFFSVFIFIFKGRTATFAGLVNRLTSLVAGTTATLLSAVFFGMRAPKREDWFSLGLIFVAVAFLTVAERKRAQELAAAREVEAAGVPGPVLSGAGAEPAGRPT